MQYVLFMYIFTTPITKSPKQRLETYCFCSVLLLLFSFFLSVDHELVHGKSQELLDRIS